MSSGNPKFWLHQHFATGTVLSSVLSYLLCIAGRAWRTFQAKQEHLACWENCGGKESPRKRKRCWLQTDCVGWSTTAAVSLPQTSNSISYFSSFGNLCKHILMIKLSVCLHDCSYVSSILNLLPKPQLFNFYSRGWHLMTQDTEAFWDSSVRQVSTTTRNST